MGGGLSKELAALCVLPDHAEQQVDNLDAIKIIEKVHQTFLLAKETLVDAICSNRDPWGEDKLESTFENISELYEKYQCLCELGRGYMIEKWNIPGHTFYVFFLDINIS